MSNKAYFMLIATLVISTISMFYLSSNDGEEKQQSTIDKVVLEESVGIDEEGGIITPAAKNFTLKKEHKKREVQKTLSMKLYEKEDNDAFITRIDQEIEDAQYEAENSYIEPSELEMQLEEEIDAQREELENILASHQAMRVAFHESEQNDFIEDETIYEEENTQYFN